MSDCGEIFGMCVPKNDEKSTKTRDILIMVSLIVTIIVYSCAGICCYLVRQKRRRQMTYSSEQISTGLSISDQESTIFHINLNASFEKETSVAEGSNV